MVSIKPEIRLDDKDRLIFEALQENPDATQQEISLITGLSQPAVGSKVKKMRELGIIDHSYGIEIRNAGSYIPKVEVKSSNPKDLIKTFEDCPFFLNGFIVTNEMNVTLMFACEQLKLDQIVDKHIRPRKDVHQIDTGSIVSVERNTYVPIKFNVTSNKTPSCGAPCHNCDYCFNGLCPGCPLTRYTKRDHRLRLITG